MPVAIYLAFNAGKPAAHGWGAAMSTDTAFALGHARARRAALPRPAARLPADRRRRRRPRRARRDRHRLHRGRRAGAARWSRSRCSRRCSRPRRAASAAGSSTSLLGVALVGRAVESGVDPVVVGLAMGLLALRLPGRARGSRARDRAASASSASSRPPSSRARRAVGLEPAISPNERLQQLYHPWTSYVIVPLFALANAGIALDGDFLARAFTLAGHARHRARLRRRQAGRHRRRRWLVHPAQPRPAAAAGRLGGGRAAAARSPGSASRSRC